MLMARLFFTASLNEKKDYLSTLRTKFNSVQYSRGTVWILLLNHLDTFLKRIGEFHEPALTMSLHNGFLANLMYIQHYTYNKEVSNLLLGADVFYERTSAITPTHPAITAAFACAPDIPPRPAVRNTLPARLSTPRYFLPAFINVICVRTIKSYCDISPR